jgi:hypothetical protein
MFEIVITCTLSIVVLLLGYLVWYRFQAEKEAIRIVYNLTDLEKSYINIVVRKSRIEPHEQQDSDAGVLGKLVDEEWLFAMADGVIIADQKTNYLAKALN